MSDSELWQWWTSREVEWGPMTFHEAKGRGLWIRSAHVWVVSSVGRILCHRRSEKASNPGKWNAHFGGYGRAGENGEFETYRQTGVREVAEEIGLIAAASLRPYDVHLYPPHRTLQAVFTTRWEGDLNTLTLDPDEVAEVAWWTPAQVRNASKLVRFGYEEPLLQKIEGGEI